MNVSLNKESVMQKSKYIKSPYDAFPQISHTSLSAMQKKRNNSNSVKNFPIPKQMFHFDILYRKKTEWNIKIYNSKTLLTQHTQE